MPFGLGAWRRQSAHPDPVVVGGHHDGPQLLHYPQAQVVLPGRAETVAVSIIKVHLPQELVNPHNLRWEETQANSTCANDCHMHVLQWRSYLWAWEPGVWKVAENINTIYMLSTTKPTAIELNGALVVVT